MGILIILGISILGIGLYIKINNLSSINNENLISLSIPEGMSLKDYKIKKNNIILFYENSKKIIISFYKIGNGKNIKQIEILK